MRGQTHKQNTSYSITSNQQNSGVLPLKIVFFNFKLFFNDYIQPANGTYEIV